MFVIGIAGGSGSGKTTLVRRLMAESPAVGHLPHDGYYLNRDDMPQEHRDNPNWDHPDVLETELFLRHIDALKHGQRVDRPDYDFEIHRRKTATVPVAPGPVLLVDGILVLAIKAVRKRLDLKVFIDTPPDLRVLRRIERDVAERERKLPEIVQQYLTSVRPMHDQFVEPSKRFADVVIPWELHNDQAVALLAARVREHLSEEN